MSRSSVEQILADDTVGNVCVPPQKSSQFCLTECSKIALCSYAIGAVGLCWVMILSVI